MYGRHLQRSTVSHPAIKSDRAQGISPENQAKNEGAKESKQSVPHIDADVDVDVDVAVAVAVCCSLFVVVVWGGAHKVGH